MKTNRTKTISRSARAGFTLTELLIVMAILVLIVSLVAPRLLGSKQKADISSVKTQIGMFQTSLERYHVDMNKFPNNEEGLGALVARPQDGDSGGDSGESGLADVQGEAPGGGSEWDGPYLKSETLPRDPWGNPYAYSFPPTHNKIGVPDIWSFGPDGVENSEDDIVSWTGDGSGPSGDGDEMLTN